MSNNWKYDWQPSLKSKLQNEKVINHYGAIVLSSNCQLSIYMDNPTAALDFHWKCDFFSCIHLVFFCWCSGRPLCAYYSYRGQWPGRASQLKTFHLTCHSTFQPWSCNPHVFATRTMWNGCWTALTNSTHIDKAWYRYQLLNLNRHLGTYWN